MKSSYQPRASLTAPCLREGCSTSIAPRFRGGGMTCNQHTPRTREPWYARKEGQTPREEEER